MQQIGLPALQPGDELVQYHAFFLAYADKYEQARWVAHLIPQDVLKGMVTRTNDFRDDDKVKTGSALEAYQYPGRRECAGLAVNR